MVPSLLFVTVVLYVLDYRALCRWPCSSLKERKHSQLKIQKYSGMYHLPQTTKWSDNNRFVLKNNFNIWLYLYGNNDAMWICCLCQSQLLWSAACWFREHFEEFGILIWYHLARVRYSNTVKHWVCSKLTVLAKVHRKTPCSWYSFVWYLVQFLFLTFQ